MQSRPNLRSPHPALQLHGCEPSAGLRPHTGHAVSGCSRSWVIFTSLYLAFSSRSAALPASLPPPSPTSPQPFPRPSPPLSQHSAALLTLSRPPPTTPQPFRYQPAPVPSTGSPSHPVLPPSHNFAALPLPPLAPIPPLRSHSHYSAFLPTPLPLVCSPSSCLPAAPPHSSVVLPASLPAPLPTLRSSSRSLPSPVPPLRSPSHPSRPPHIHC